MFLFLNDYLATAPKQPLQSPNSVYWWRWSFLNRKGHIVHRKLFDFAAYDFLGDMKLGILFFPHSFPFLHALLTLLEPGRGFHILKTRLQFSGSHDITFCKFMHRMVAWWRAGALLPFSSSGIGKLWLIGQIQSATWFCFLFFGDTIDVTLY